MSAVTSTMGACASSIFYLAGFQAEVSKLLGVSVDVVSDRGTGPTMESVTAEAPAL